MRYAIMPNGRGDPNPPGTHPESLRLTRPSENRQQRDLSAVFPAAEGLVRPAQVPGAPLDRATAARTAPADRLQGTNRSERQRAEGGSERRAAASGGRQRAEGGSETPEAARAFEKHDDPDGP